LSWYLLQRCYWTTCLGKGRKSEEYLKKSEEGVYLGRKLKKNRRNLRKKAYIGEVPEEEIYFRKEFGRPAEATEGSLR